MKVSSISKTHFKFNCSLLGVGSKDVLPHVKVASAHEMIIPHPLQLLGLHVTKNHYRKVQGPTCAFVFVFAFNVSHCQDPLKLGLSPELSHSPGLLFVGPVSQDRASKQSKRKKLLFTQFPFTLLC